MSMYKERKSTGMTLLRHLAIRRGKAIKRNPNAVIGITVGDAEQIITEFKEMKEERDKAMRLLGIRAMPKGNIDWDR